MSQRAVIKFKVSFRPESSGIRIRTTDPTGVYCSVVDREAAKTYFEYCVLELASERGLVDRYPGTTLGERVPWDTIIDSASGEGEVIVVVASQEHIDDVQATGTKVEASSLDAAKMDCWLDPDGKKFWIVRDNGDFIDPWVVDEIKRDILHD